jgi:chromosomal replication initiator protein
MEQAWTAAAGARTAPGEAGGRVRDDAWRDVLGLLEVRVPARDMDSWIRPLELEHASADEVRIRAPNRFVHDWVHDNLLHALESAWTEYLGVRAPVHLTCEAHEPEPAFPTRKSARGLDPRMTFETFVVGRCNEFAHAAALAVADAPGRANNPLFIYGHTGLGKTHLLHAIGNRVAERGGSVYAWSAEHFFSAMVQAIRTRSVSDFRERFAAYDVLLLDDVQFVGNRDRTQEELFHVFDSMRAAQKHIIFTSDKPPHEIEKLEPRLRTRFECGLLADVQPPDIETMMAILDTKAAAMRLEVPMDVQYAVAQKCRNSVRELEGALNRLSAMKAFYGRPVTLQLVQERMADLLPTVVPPPNADRILQVVSDHYNVRVQDIRGTRRPANIVRPRQVAMYLCRHRASLSFPEIGRVFQKDNSTVQHGVHRIEELVASDPNVRAEVEVLERRLRDGT